MFSCNNKLKLIRVIISKMHEKRRQFKAVAPPHKNEKKDDYNLDNLVHKRHED
jgi:hypothetical protein